MRESDNGKTKKKEKKKVYLKCFSEVKQNTLVCLANSLHSNANFLKGPEAIERDILYVIN